MWAADDSRLDALKSQLEATDEPAVLAVSGGSDSTALMVLAARLRPVRRPIVVTVDHCLRDGSRNDCAYVAALAKEFGLEHQTLVWTHLPLTSRIQEAAREARYQLISDWMATRGLTRLLVAHTMDDQAETFAMRLARASGPSGLAGMRPQTVRQNITIVRPLLRFSRRELRDFLKRENIGWLEDPANESLDFERIRTRKALAHSRIENVAPDVLALAATRQYRADQALEAATDAFMQTAVTIYETGHGAIERAAFAAAPAEIAIRALARMVNWTGAREIPHRLSRLEALYERLAGTQSGHHTLKGAHIAARKATIIIGREFGRMDRKPVTSKLWDNRFAFDKAARIAPLGSIEGADKWKCPKDMPAFVSRTLPVVLTSKGNFAPHLDPEHVPKPVLANLPAGINRKAILTL